MCNLLRWLINTASNKKVYIYLCVLPTQLLEVYLLNYVIDQVYMYVLGISTSILSVFIFTMHSNNLDFYDALARLNKILVTKKQYHWN